MSDNTDAAVASKMKALQRRYRVFELKDICRQLQLSTKVDDAFDTESLARRIVTWQAEHQGQELPRPRDNLLVMGARLCLGTPIDFNSDELFNEIVELGAVGNVPAHLFAEALSFVPAFPQLISLRRTCKQWKKIIDGIVIPQVTCLDFVDRLSREELEHRLLPATTAMTHLLRLQQMFPKVSKLRLYLDAFQATNHHVWLGTVRSFPQVRELEILAVSNYKTIASSLGTLAGDENFQKFTCVKFVDMSAPPLVAESKTTTASKDQKKDKDVHKKFATNEPTIVKFESLQELLQYLKQHEGLHLNRFHELQAFQPFSSFVTASRDEEDEAKPVDYKPAFRWLVEKGLVADAATFMSMLDRDVELALLLLDSADDNALQQYAQKLQFLQAARGQGRTIPVGDKIADKKRQDTTLETASRILSHPRLASGPIASLARVNLMRGAIANKHAELVQLAVKDMSQEDIVSVYESLVQILIPHLARVPDSQFEAELASYEQMFGGAQQFWTSRDATSGTTSLHEVAKQPPSNSMLKLLDRILEFVSTKEVDASGKTPLHVWASQPFLFGSVLITGMNPAVTVGKKLLEHHPDVDSLLDQQEKENNRTPLMCYLLTSAGVGKQDVQTEITRLLLPRTDKGWLIDTPDNIFGITLEAYLRNPATIYCLEPIFAAAAAKYELVKGIIAQVSLEAIEQDDHGRDNLFSHYVKSWEAQHGFLQNAPKSMPKLLREDGALPVLLNLCYWVEKPATKAKKSEKRPLFVRDDEDSSEEEDVSRYETLKSIVSACDLLGRSEECDRALKIARDVNKPLSNIILNAQTRAREEAASARLARSFGAVNLGDDSEDEWEDEDDEENSEASQMQRTLSHRRGAGRSQAGQAVQPAKSTTDSQGATSAFTFNLGADQPAFNFSSNPFSFGTSESSSASASSNTFSFGASSLPQAGQASSGSGSSNPFSFSSTSSTATSAATNLAPSSSFSFAQDPPSGNIFNFS